LEQLPGLSRQSLLQRFQSVYGKEPPLRLSDRLLALAIAYRLQEQAHGGLRSSVRRGLLAGAAPPATSIGPGTVLIREWQGQQHTVSIIDGAGIEYQGQRFRSLTEVAFRITGQKRSGPAFFGLRDKSHG
jgi:hypothetical protein